MTWLFLIGWCCHLLLIVTLLVLSGATDMANENSLDQHNYASNNKPLPQLERTTHWNDNKAFAVTD